MVVELSCQAFSEKIPWLLNGTLEEAERGAVVEHLRSCEACQRELHEAIFVARVVGQHPEASRLVSLALGEEVIGREAIERHLEHCPDCPEHMSLIRASGDPRDLRSAAEIVAVPPTSRAGFWRPLALAACLLAAVGAGGMMWSLSRLDQARQKLAVVELETSTTEVATRVAELERHISDLEGPRVDIEEHYGVVTRDGGAEPWPVRRDVLLIVPLNDTLAGPYGLELWSGDRRVLRTELESPEEEERYLRVFLPRAYLERNAISRYVVDHEVAGERRQLYAREVKVE